jgi:hypothetical protein
MVLNVRCEAHHANLVIDTLYNNSDKMEMHDFGLFMSYEHARLKNNFYGELLKRNNIFHNSTEIFSIYGLHEEVLHGETIDFLHETKYYAFPYLTGLAITEHNKVTNETRETAMIHAIERTNKSDESGRWLVVANKRLAKDAENSIREIVDDWILTKAFEKYKDKNESYRKGIRFSYNVKPPASIDVYMSHKQTVKNSMDYYDNEMASLNSTSVNTSTKKRKKINPVSFEFSDQAYPVMSSHGAKTDSKPNAWNKSPSIINNGSHDQTASV